MSTDLTTVKAGLAAIGPNADGRFTYASRTPPEGYATLRDMYKYADVHPSWLRTLISKGGFDQYDQEGAPAVIKNERGVWAVRIDAVKDYEAGKRERKAPGEGTGAAYSYEPMVLKTSKRTLSECKKRKAPVEVVSYLETLVAELKQEWTDGKIGKGAAEDKPEADEGNDEAAEAAAQADMEDEEEDFEFDFDED